MLPGPVTRSTRAHGPGAVGEHRDRLGSPDGVHLLDAEQRAGGQDRGVRQPAVVLLRGGGQRDRPDAGDLGGHDVHQHAGHQRRQAAGDVEPDPVDRHHPLGHRGAGGHVGGDVLLELGLAGGAQPGDGLLETRAHVGVQVLEGGRERRRRHPDVVVDDPVELRGELQDRVDPADPDGLADRMHRGDGGLDVELGARHGGAVVDGLAVGACPPQVDAADHGLDSRCARPPAPGRGEGARHARTPRLLPPDRLSSEGWTTRCRCSPSEPCCSRA